MRRALLMIPAALLTACGEPPTCGEAECASICAEPAAATPAPAAPADAAGSGDLTSFEQSLLDPMLQEVRMGVRPFSVESVGVCKGQGKACTEYLGVDAGVLPPGQYMVRAEFAVPKVGDKGTWKVEYAGECTTVKKTANGESSSSSSDSKEYTVTYTGTDHGYRLSPLRTINSPNKGGEKTCTWQITALHPDGDKVTKGSYTVPEA